MFAGTVRYSVVAQGFERWSQTKRREGGCICYLKANSLSNGSKASESMDLVGTHFWWLEGRKKTGLSGVKW